MKAQRDGFDPAAAVITFDMMKESGEIVPVGGGQYLDKDIANIKTNPSGLSYKTAVRGPIAMDTPDGPVVLYRNPPSFGFHREPTPVHITDYDMQASTFKPGMRTWRQSEDFIHGTIPSMPHYNFQICPVDCDPLSGRRDFNDPLYPEVCSFKVLIEADEKVKPEYGRKGLHMAPYLIQIPDKALLADMKRPGNVGKTIKFIPSLNQALERVVADFRNKPDMFALVRPSEFDCSSLRHESYQKRYK